MTLELFKINPHESNISDIECFAIDNSIVINSIQDEKTTSLVAEKWKYTQCTLLQYRKFEIDRMPKNMRWFVWLLFHNFNYFVATTANLNDVRNKIETFLDFTGGN